MKRRKFLTLMGVGAAAGAASGSAVALFRETPEKGGLQILNEATAGSVNPLPTKETIATVIDHMTASEHSVRCVAFDERNQNIADMITETLRKDVAETMDKAMHEAVYGGTGLLYTKEMSDRLRVECVPVVKFRKLVDQKPFFHDVTKIVNV